MFICDLWSIFGYDKCATSNFDSKSKPKYSNFYLEEDVWLFLSFVDHHDPLTTTSSIECSGQSWVKNGLPYCTIVNESGIFFTDIDKLIFVFGYSIPFVGLIASYSLIHKSIKQFATGREWQVTKTSLIAVGSYVFVYTPGFIVNIFNKWSGENAFPELNVAVILLGWTHAFINPIIYIFFNRFFYNEFCRVLKINNEGNSSKDTSSTVKRCPSA